MKTILLSRDEVLAGYDAVSALYPHIPPLATWRGWEYAAYRRYRLAEPVLDVGCGDGRYFRLAWPDVRDVIGIELDPATAESSRRSGVYRDLYVAAADVAPTPTASCGSAFANCALEHMENLPAVLTNIRRTLVPGGTFLLSVVTDNWRRWAVLPLLARLEGMSDRAAELQEQHDRYHHLVNAFPPEDWAAHLARAGFEVIEHVPIVPELTGRFVLFFDQIWHLPIRRPESGVEEVGGQIHAALAALPDFPASFRQVLRGLTGMERHPEIGCGAVFRARRAD